MIDRMSRWAVERRFAVFGLIGALILAGIWALRTLRVEALPDLTDVQVQVLIEAPGLSPVGMERLATFRAPAPGASATCSVGTSPAPAAIVTMS